MRKTTSLWRGLTFVFSAMLSLSVVASVVMEQNRGEIDGFFNTHSSQVISTDDGTLYSAYTPDSEYLNQDGTGNSQAVVDAHVNLNTQLSEEGSVLLKNTGVLPLSKESKVTLLGIRSHVILAGSGMGVSAKAGQVVQLEEALAEKYEINGTMSDVYETVNQTQKLTNNDRASTSFDPKEASLAQLQAANPDYKSSFTQFGDAAIVVVGRPNSEMGDYAPGQGGVVEGTGATTAMELTTNERDAIKLATDNFDKVIVLLNTNSAMEIEELKQNEKIGAILWVGHPGCYGVYGIANLLTGESNPSGGLYDLYATDSLSAPAMQNMGNFAYSNPSTDFTRVPTNGSNNKYLIEAEGIYVGYRYYETRYEDVVLGRGNANSSTGAGRFDTEGGWNYDKEVSYGFGYGLSYTTFEQKIENTSVVMNSAPHSMDTEITVTVQNTGKVAGKTSVQIYGQAPYITGGVEKASVQLLAFDKTDILQPGETQTMTISVDMQNLASWDSSAMDGNGSYILDEGDYYFAVGNGAHDALNNILAAKGKTTADGMDYNGNSAKALKWTYNYVGGTVDESTFNITKAGTQVKNSLETADWNYWKDGEVTYLSRNSWDTTWPESYTDMLASAEMVDRINGNNYEIKTDDDVSEIVFNAEGDMVFAEMNGADYDDPRWETLLNQLDLTEALNFILHGNREYLAMPSVGFLAGRYTENGPNGIGGRGFGSLSYNNFGENPPEWYISEDDENASFGMNIFPSAPVVASTFNPELAYEQGRLIGNDALFVGLPILWGPGMNTHRSPYNGRNGEYYSEDPILTGVVGMEFSIGALDKGLIAAPKHYAFNDQETNRTGVAPYLEEQRAREVELRAFQLAFEAAKYDEERGEDVGMLGVMASFSKIGPDEVTASKGMIKDILYGEWGFNGYIVSDMNDDADQLTDCLYAGLTSFDATYDLENSKIVGYGITADMYKKDATILQAVKDAIHHNLYVLAQSNYMNMVNTSSYTVEVMTSWRIGYTVAICVTAVLTIGCAAVYVLSLVKSKKEA